MKRSMRAAVVFLLRAYKWALSPLLPPACRYVPTCSEYAMEAVDCYGIVRGGCMAAWRVLRCHPFVKGGFDPVTRREPSAHFEAAHIAPRG
jgi:hypothetical protein